MDTKCKPQVHRHGTRTTSYRVRLTVDEKNELAGLAAGLGMTVADVFRLGAREYLERRAA